LSILYPRIIDKVKYVSAISITYGILAFIMLGFIRYYKISPIISNELPLPVDLNFYNALALAILISLAPPGILLHYRCRIVDEVERFIPLFLRDTAELTRAGASIVRAIIELSEKPYGRWSRVLRRIAIRISLGEEFEETVVKTLKGLPETIKRYVLMILEAYRSGGRAAETLDDAARFAAIIRGFEEEKRRSLRIYGIVLYTSMIIFLLAAGITIYMSKALIKEGAGAEGGLIKVFTTPETLTAIFYITGLFEAIFAGLVVGKLVRGAMVAGIIHVIILLTMVIMFINGLGLFI